MARFAKGSAAAKVHMHNLRAMQCTKMFKGPLKPLRKKKNFIGPRKIGGKINWGSLAKGALAAGQSQLGQAAIGAARGYAGVGLGSMLKKAKGAYSSPLGQAALRTALQYA